MRAFLFAVLASSYVIVARPAAADGTEAAPASQKTAATPPPSQGFSYKPDAGIVYQSGDFSVTAWGYVERLVDPDGPGSWRRFRQGAEFDLPRLNDRLRPAIVYEIDLTDSNFFKNGFGGRNGFGRRDFENLFVALQDPGDPGQFRVLVGQNTHILSREDNLASGNLPTINRSLILEEHGSVNSFGTQFGVEVQKTLSHTLAFQLAASDNRGSFNAPEPRYDIGNSLAAKIIVTPISDDARGRKLTLGFAVDNTRNIRNRVFTLATAIAQTPLGNVPATGDQLTGEADIAYTFPFLAHPMTVEGEAIYSRFSESRSDVGGGYVMVQWSLFDTRNAGDLDFFGRYDVVSLGQARIVGRAEQRALRTGFNYNLPRTNKLANLHIEYAHNSIAGPATIVTGPPSSDEFRVELRLSLQRYVRH